MRNFRAEITLKRVYDLKKRKSHQDFEVERELADLYFMLLDIPRWKFWEWLPLSFKIHNAACLHKDCCDIEI